MIPRLKTKYENEIIPLMTKKFGYGNRMEVPRFVKIAINMGVGDSLENIKLLDAQLPDGFASLGMSQPALP